MAVCTAVAARKVRRPVRCVLTRQEDMLSTGGRHPFACKYKVKIARLPLFFSFHLNLQVGFSSAGKIIALDSKIYNNAGSSLDLSGAVMDRALFHSENCYKIPNMKVTGHVCRTNLPSNTAFRGFGGPQVYYYTIFTYSNNNVAWTTKGNVFCRILDIRHCPSLRHHANRSARTEFLQGRGANSLQPSHWTLHGQKLFW